MKMFERTFNELVDVSQGGIAAQVAKGHSVELANLLRLIPATHHEPASDLVLAVDRWLADRCEGGAALMAEHRVAVWSFENDHPGHCRKAWLRLLHRRGIGFAKANGRRILIGLQLRN